MQSATRAFRGKTWRTLDWHALTHAKLYLSKKRLIDKHLLCDITFKDSILLCHQVNPKQSILNGRHSKLQPRWVQSALLVIHSIVSEYTCICCKLKRWTMMYRHVRTSSSYHEPCSPWPQQKDHRCSRQWMGIYILLESYRYWPLQCDRCITT